MATKLTLERADVVQILAHYDCGVLENVTPLTAGTVQTNLLLETTAGKFVLRLYSQNRSFNAVCFEVNLINYLKSRHYPCAAVLRNRAGRFVGLHLDKPYVLFAFLAGMHIAQPTTAQQQQLIQKVAELQLLTAHYRPLYRQDRWNYDVAFCKRLAAETAEKIGTLNAQKKLAWYQRTLAELDLPQSHPKGICHCDFHFSNVLFLNGTFHALLDFDDANYTFLTFDLVSLIEPDLFRFHWDSWQTVAPTDSALDFARAREIITVYEAIRPLNTLEKRHLFDVLKLAILIDCLWFFARGDADDFYEKRKIDQLDMVGRVAVSQALFGD